MVLGPLVGVDEDDQGVPVALGVAMGPEKDRGCEATFGCSPLAFPVVFPIDSPAGLKPLDYRKAKRWPKRTVGQLSVLV